MLTGDALVRAVLKAKDRYALLSLGSEVPIVLSDGYVNLEDEEIRRSYTKIAARIHPDDAPVLRRPKRRPDERCPLGGPGVVQRLARRQEKAVVFLVGTDTVERAVKKQDAAGEGVREVGRVGVEDAFAVGPEFPGAGMAARQPGCPGLRTGGGNLTKDLTEAPRPLAKSRKMHYARLDSNQRPWD